MEFSEKYAKSLKSRETRAWKTNQEAVSLDMREQRV